MPTRNPAPGDLAIVERFLRTRDSVADDASMRAWFRSEGIGVRPDPAALGRFVDVREALRDMAQSHNGGPSPVKARSYVNGEIVRLGIRPRIADGDVIGFESPLPDPLGVVLAAFCSSLADGTWDRMKACAADDCSYAFYDGTKNRSARWCDVGGCGARHRMREFRRRGASGAPPPSIRAAATPRSTNRR